ncbi:Uu.00g026010.m01.CDS01 [Anthostomella pinea]|uniref:Uu.00g026010.m01.CDS01 n=1 Tax=Anthostomella pinea TaxID=933095 RepID=A0AAI8V2M9_9PEZI|nr:Uu.00g026010.m01.CDS01 [Anthostomella pinea]
MAETRNDSAREADAGLELRRKTSQAVDEGHDADIPSSQGYVLNEAGELKRLQSIADLRKKTSATKDSSPDRDVEKGDVPQEGVDGNAEHTDDETDPNVVWWDGPDDPENPYNWPLWRKLVNCGLISTMTFISPLASSIFAPGVPQVVMEFHSTSLEIATFVVSVYLLGFAAGPILIAPLSEIYGRVIVYHVCNVGFVAFAVGCALAPSLNSLIAFRFLFGIFGSAPLTNGGGTIADMIAQEKRGAALAAYSIGPLLGPVIGPVAGGFLSDAEGWRWTFWLLAIAGGLVSIVELFALKESYAPVIIQRKVARLRKETGNDLLRSKLDIGLSPGDYFKRAVIRPIKMIFKSPIVAIMSLYTAVTYGYLYVMFTTMTEVFEETYGFNTSTVGLSFLGLGVGSLIGIGLYSSTSDKYIRRKAAEADRAAEASGSAKTGMKPEYRLPMLPLGAALIPAGLFIYGWTADYKVHWIAPIIGTGVVGAGNLIVFLSIQTYLVDAFTIYAASALATNTIVRSVAGAVLPLAGLKLYAKLGLGWGNSLLAFIAIALLPVSFGLLKYGELLRNNFPIKNL